MREKVQWLSAAIVGIGVLAVTSRRWSAPLLACALGMGLFVGIAFGPALDRLDAQGSQVIAVNDSSSPSTDVSAPVGAAGGDGSGGSSSASSDGSDSAPLDTGSDPYVPPAVPAAVPAPVDEEDPVDDTGTDDGTDDSASDPGSDDDPAAPLTLSGTVVHVNPAAGSYALAVRGELYGVHAESLPKAGDEVDAPLRALANGTYAEDGKRSQTSSTDSGPLNGFVTYVAPDDAEPAYVLSARGVSLLIHGSAGKLPKLGEFVSVDAAIAASKGAPRSHREAPSSADGAAATDCVREEPGKEIEPRERLTEKGLDPTGDRFTYFDLAGTVQAICPESGELVISADDIRQAGVDLTLQVPKSIDLEALEVDQPVLATAELAEDGTLEMAGVASDDGVDGADDSGQLQGDFAGG